jgi:hypothetical protein
MPEKLPEPPGPQGPRGTARRVRERRGPAGGRRVRQDGGLAVMPSQVVQPAEGWKAFEG